MHPLTSRNSLNTLLALFCALLILLGGSLAQAADPLPAPGSLFIVQFYQGEDDMDQLFLGWLPVDGGSNYEVFIKGPSPWGSNTNGAWLAANFPENNIHHFQNLKRGKVFYFRVRALDDQGNPGNTTRRMQLKIPPRAVEPQGVVSADSIKLSWDPVKNGMGKKTRVYYCEGADCAPSSYDDEVPVYRRKKANITGLKSDTDYTVRIVHHLRGYHPYVSHANVVFRTLPAGG